MNDTDKQLNKLETIIGLLEQDKVTPAELEQFLSTIGEILRDMKANFESEISTSNQQYNIGFKEIVATLEDLEIRVRSTIRNLESSVMENIKILSKRILPLRDEIAAIKVPDITPLAEDINILETEVTKNGEVDKKQSSDIEELRKELAEIKDELSAVKKTKAVNNYIGGGTRAASVGYYDLSASLDGLTKTFAIPKHKKIIGVWCSSTPGVLRPMIDFTMSGNNMTFTSQIDAASTLATGQTIIVLYGQLFGP